MPRRHKQQHYMKSLAVHRNGIIYQDEIGQHVIRWEDIKDSSVTERQHPLIATHYYVTTVITTKEGAMIKIPHKAFGSHARDLFGAAMTTR